MPSLGDIAALLRQAGVKHYSLGSPELGQALVIEAGARVLAIAPAGSDQNIFWLHPALSACHSTADVALLGAGGIGGLRLWQAPEAGYMWEGRPNVDSFSNYRVQPGMDPGSYHLQTTGRDACTWEAEIQLTDYRSDKQLRFAVRREITLRPLPTPPAGNGNRGVSVAFKHTLRLLEAEDRSARVDLWHLLQLPVGTTIGARLHPGAAYSPYFNAPKIMPLSNESGYLLWPANGRRISKIGLDARDVTSGPYGIRLAFDRFQCCYWHVPILPAGEYVDAPPGLPPTHQVLQFWDGFDFCEIEYHTPAASYDTPEIVDTSELFVIEGPVSNRPAISLVRDVVEGLAGTQ